MDQIMNKIELKATHSGDLTIVNKKISCVVLEDGQRLISETSIFEAFERPRRGSRESDKRIKLPSFIAANNLLPYITQDVIDVITPIKYLDISGKIKSSYKAEILPVLCDIYLQARKDNVLASRQARLAEISEIMVRALSKLGIIALIDEATGYQHDRAKNALQHILDRYLNQEFAKWAKRFPDEFYIEMFRLKGWKFSDNGIIKKRPGIVGTYTNNIVYERLAPGLLEELKNRNPKDEKGHTKARHHQLLTTDTGVPALNMHLFGVIGLMKASKTWSGFMSLLQSAYPKLNEQLELFNSGEL